MPIKRWTDDQLKAAIETSTSFKETILKLGVKTNSLTVRKHALRLSLSLSHFKNVSYCFNKWERRLPLRKLLSNDPEVKINSSSIKERILRLGLLIEKCYRCSCAPIWLGETLTLQLDHINGCSTDNRLENLRLLCPNCHSQTKTYCGRNLGRDKEREEPRVLSKEEAERLIFLFEEDDKGLLSKGKYIKRHQAPK